MEPFDTRRHRHILRQESFRLVDLLGNRAMQDAPICIAIEAQLIFIEDTYNLRADEELLRIAAKEQQSCMGGADHRTSSSFYTCGAAEMQQHLFARREATRLPASAG